MKNLLSEISNSEKREKYIGKTGTGEIKNSQYDENGTEIGWFDSFDDNGNLIVTMCEDVKNRGESNYVVRKMANIWKNLE